MTTDLSALRARVEEAKGADREIDAALFAALYLNFYAPIPSHGVKPYTASLDAALGLVEAKLPEWQIISFTMGWRGPGKLHDHLPETWRKRYARADLEVACVAELRRSEHSYVSAKAEAPTPALALIAALLSALETQ